METTESLRRKTKELQFVSQADWLVDSEFATNTRGIILDMSKLAIGASSYKLFVAAHRKEETEKKLLKSLSPLARSCNSSLFFALVPHPKVWLSKGQAEPVIYRWSVESDQWLLHAGKLKEK